MATGYIFTKTGNSSTKVVHVTNDVVDLGRTKIFKGPVLIEDNDPSLISIKEGGGNAMSLNISAIITIDGSAPAGTMQGVIDQLDAVFPEASTSGGSGGGAGAVITAFSASIPFNKDYSYMYKVVTGAISFTPNASGAVVGNWTLVEMVANGVNLPTFDGAFIKLSNSDEYDNTAGRVNFIAFFKNTSGYTYSIALGDIVALPDTTPPTVVSVTATDAHTIDVLLSESFTGTTGFSFGSLTVTARTPVSGNKLRHTITETMLNTDTIPWAYTPGDITDNASTPNALAATSGSVTNSINVVLFQKTFDDITAPWSNFDYGGATTTISTADGGIAKAHLSDPGPSALTYVSRSGGYTAGDLITITIDCHIISGAPLLILGSAGSDYVVPLIDGVNSYVINTAGFPSSPDVFLQTPFTDSGSEVYIRSILCTK